jgi:hypothetical protein
MIQVEDQVFYHRTTAEKARQILKNGFKDITSDDSRNPQSRGIWLSDKPLGDNEGAEGDTLIKVTLDLPEEELEAYKWVEEGQTFREWFVPAELINPHMKVEIVNLDQHLI